MGVYSGSHDVLKFWEISANISETVQDSDMLHLKTNNKLHQFTCPIKWHQYQWP